MQLTVPIETRRRQRAALIQKLQHVVIAFVLLLDGLARFGKEAGFGSFALATAEVVTSALVILFFARAIKKSRVASEELGHHGVDWVDIFLGVMLVIEALVHRQETGHLPGPKILLAAVTFVLGLAHGRVWTFGQRRRALRVTETGISLGSRWGSRLTATWPEIDRFEVSPERAELATRTGAERSIDIAGLTNRPQVLEALTVAHDRWEAAKALRLEGSSEVQTAAV